MGEDSNIESFPNADVRNRKDLITEQIEFQNRVFKKAGVETKTQKLNFVKKENLLEVLENSRENFSKKYPEFNKTEIENMLKAMYE